MRSNGEQANKPSQNGAPTMTEAGDELPAFEPPSRPDVAGGLLEARLTTNGGAGAPRTVQLALEHNS